jgi:hypothetical protein
MTRKIMKMEVAKLDGEDTVISLTLSAMDSLANTVPSRRASLSMKIVKNNANLWVAYEYI